MINLKISIGNLDCWVSYFPVLVFQCMPPVWKALLGTADEREKAMEEVRECLKTLESVLNGKKFFGER